MSLVRVQNFSISLDGFGTGEGQSHDAHFGHAGDRLHEWMFATGCGSPAAAAASTTPSPAARATDRRRDHGCRKVRPPRMARGPGKAAGTARGVPTRRSTGPVFVLTHHTRPPIEMAGGTMFHFIDGRRPRRSRRPARLPAANTYASAEAPQ